MKTSNTLVWLSSLIMVLASIAAGVGLLWQDEGSPFTFTTLRGQTVQIYGQGLYRYDTPIVAIGLKAADAVTLFLAIPLCLLALVLYRRGSLKGRLLLAGTLAYFLYMAISLAFGAAYNTLFLVYVALLALSLFAFILALASFDLAALPSHFSAALPRRGIGIYLIVSGAVLMLIWLALSIIPAMLQGQAPPEVWSYTTVITFVLDLGIIAPALIVSGGLLLRRAPIGYLLAATLLVFTVVLGVNLTAGGVVQVLAGVISLGQFIGMSASFTILTLFAMGFTVALFRSFSESVTERTASRAVHGTFSISQKTRTG
jgi:hypothetical protein